MQDERKTKAQLVRELGTLKAELKRLEQSDDDTVGGVQIISRDVTERKQAAAVVRESQYQYRDSHCNASPGIFHSSFEMKFLDVNPALAKLLGSTTPEEGVTSIAEQANLVSPDRDAVGVAILDAGGLLTSDNSRIVSQDGSSSSPHCHPRTGIK
ncbi:MAG: PAS domain-containing protein [Ignavibacteriales bacterium]|nr:PAS domain-containing protein [Ignavibacteriales bacterium]